MKSFLLPAVWMIFTSCGALASNDLRKVNNTVTVVTNSSAVGGEIATASHSARKLLSKQEEQYAKVVAVAVVGRIPIVGDIFGGLLDAFWDTDDDVWDQIEDRVKSLIHESIFAEHADLCVNAMKDAERAMANYVRNKSAKDVRLIVLLDHLFDAAYALDLDDVTEMTDDDPQLDYFMRLIEMHTSAALLHTAVAKEQYLHGNDIFGNEQDSANRLADLQAALVMYESAFNFAYRKYYDWRLSHVSYDGGIGMYFMFDQFGEYGAPDAKTALQDASHVYNSKADAEKAYTAVKNQIKAAREALFAPVSNLKKLALGTLPPKLCKGSEVLVQNTCQPKKECSDHNHCSNGHYCMKTAGIGFCYEAVIKYSAPVALSSDTWSNGCGWYGCRVLNASARNGQTYNKDYAVGAHMDHGGKPADGTLSGLQRFFIRPSVLSEFNEKQNMCVKFGDSIKIAYTTEVHSGCGAYGCRVLQQVGTNEMLFGHGKNAASFIVMHPNGGHIGQCLNYGNRFVLQLLQVPSGITTKIVGTTKPMFLNTPGKYLDVVKKDATIELTQYFFGPWFQ